MKAEEINFNNIKSIDDFYVQLDINALHLERNHDIVEAWLKYKNHTASDLEKQKSQWEIEVFLFSFLGTRIFSFSTSNGKAVGEIKQFPQLDELQKVAFTYLQERIKSAKSNFLSARYNHILWKSIFKKNRSNASSAIDSYFLTIEEYYKLILDQKDEEGSYLIGKFYENLIGLIDEVKYSEKELKNLTEFLLYKAQKISFYLKHGIIEDMLKYPKLFIVDDYKNVMPLFEEHIKEIKDNKDYFILANHHLPSAIRLAQKTQTDLKKWYNYPGLAHMQLAKKETSEDSYWMKLSEYANAIQAFRNAGNNEAKREAEQLYSELKPKVKLTKYQIDFDEKTIIKIKAFNEGLKKTANELLTHTPKHVYATIANASFFPKYADVVKVLQKPRNHFLDFATTLYFDTNKNVTRKTIQNTEKQDLFKTYSLQIKETLLPFLHHVIISGIKSGKLTCKNFLYFLNNSSWIGKPYIKIDLGGDEEVIQWTKLLAPAICEFFAQVLAWGESKYYVPNFILCIDSLTLKLEGLFRSFCERINISTSQGKQKGMQEVLIHNVLENAAFKKYFNEDDVLFFEYLFSNEWGLNLRNNVAHSFYNEKEYHPDKMLLLIAAILRLGKYNVRNKIMKS